MQSYNQNIAQPKRSGRLCSNWNNKGYLNGVKDQLTEL